MSPPSRRARTTAAAWSSSLIDLNRLSPAVRSGLAAVLVRARDLGFLGPGAVEAQIDHSLALAGAVDPPAAGSGHLIDLGSGGGVPGLVLAGAWPESTWALVDGSTRRASFLRLAVDQLGWSDRIRILCERAEVTGRGPLRGRVALVVARGFGPPAVTAECAAPLLAVGGHLIVTDPPGGADERWPVDGLASLGLGRERSAGRPVAYQVLRQYQSCPDRFPRRVGVPAKRPLF